MGLLEIVQRNVPRGGSSGFEFIFWILCFLSIPKAISMGFKSASRVYAKRKKGFDFFGRIFHKIWRLLSFTYEPFLNTVETSLRASSTFSLVNHNGRFQLKLFFKVPPKSMIWLAIWGARFSLFLCCVLCGCVSYSSFYVSRFCSFGRFSQTNRYTKRTTPPSDKSSNYHVSMYMSKQHTEINTKDPKITIPTKTSRKKGGFGVLPPLPLQNQARATTTTTTTILSKFLFVLLFSTAFQKPLLACYSQALAVSHWCEWKSVRFWHLHTRCKVRPVGGIKAWAWYHGRGKWRRRECCRFIAKCFSYCAAYCAVPWGSKEKCSCNCYDQQFTYGIVSEGFFAEILWKAREKYVLLRQERARKFCAKLRKFRGNLRKIFCNDPFPHDPKSELLIWEQNSAKTPKLLGLGMNGRPIVILEAPPPSPLLIWWIYREMFLEIWEISTRCIALWPV